MIFPPQIIPWYIKLRLLFVRTRYFATNIDTDKGVKIAIVGSKSYQGKVYIVSEYYI